MYTMPNNYVATIRPSQGMTDFKTIQLGEVQARIAKDADGKTRIQSILFGRDKYTAESATIAAYHMYRLVI